MGPKAATPAAPGTSPQHEPRDQRVVRVDREQVLAGAVRRSGDLGDDGRTSAADRAARWRERPHVRVRAQVVSARVSSAQPLLIPTDSYIAGEVACAVEVRRLCEGCAIEAGH